MSKLSRWASAHPIAAYFSATYVLSWPLFLLVLFVFPQRMAFQATLGSLAVYSPAIASMVVGAAAQPRRVRGPPAARWGTFLVTWILAWTTFVLFATRERQAPFNAPVIVFGAVLAVLPGFTASQAFSRTAGIRRRFESLVAPRGHLAWYLVALCTFPAIQLAGGGMTRLAGARAASLSDLSISVDAATTALLFLHGFFFAGGINEESGWRGFALPRLQARYCPLTAALVVWCFWALWHLPADLASGDSVSSILLNRLFFNAMWSVLFMWVFNRTHGSLLAPAIFHPAMNASGTLLPRTDAAAALFFILVVVAIVTGRMWRRLPSTHGAVIPQEWNKA